MQEEIWQWCRDKTVQGNDVLVSEHTAPNDFRKVWSIQVSRTQALIPIPKVTENLFVHESIYDKYKAITLFD